MTINKKNFRALAKKMRNLRHEEHYDQGDYGIKTSCGTAACLAGHAAVQAGYKLYFEPYGDGREVQTEICTKLPYRSADKLLLVLQNNWENWGELDEHAKRFPSVSVTAGKYLGISDESWLFTGEPSDGWPREYAERFYASSRPSRVAADLLDAIADGKFDPNAMDGNSGRLEANRG